MVVAGTAGVLVLGTTVWIVYKKLVSYQQQIKSKDEKIEELKHEVSEKVNSIKLKNDEILAKEEKIQAKDEQIKAKEEQIQAKEETIQAKDEQINDKNDLINDKNVEIQAKNGEIKALNDLIKERNNQNEDLQRQIEHKNLDGVKKEEVIDKKNEIIEAKTKEIDEINKKFNEEISKITAKWDSEIAAKDMLIKEKDDKIKKKKDKSKEKDKKINELVEELKQKGTEIKEKETELKNEVEKSEFLLFWYNNAVESIKNDILYAFSNLDEINLKESCIVSYQKHSDNFKAEAKKKNYEREISKFDGGLQSIKTLVVWFADRISEFSELRKNDRKRGGYSADKGRSQRGRGSRISNLKVKSDWSSDEKSLYPYDKNMHKIEESPEVKYRRIRDFYQMYLDANESKGCMENLQFSITKISWEIRVRVQEQKLYIFSIKLPDKFPQKMPVLWLRYVTDLDNEVDSGNIEGPSQGQDLNMLQNNLNETHQDLEESNNQKPIEEDKVSQNLKYFAS